MSREHRKVRTGRVVSDKMDKTIIVAVQWQQRHPLYEKLQCRTTKFYAHDGAATCKLGDLVKIEETRALSRLKRWRVIDVLERREVAEVKPLELDQALLDAQRRKQVEQGTMAAAAAPVEAVQPVTAPEIVAPAPVDREEPAQEVKEVKAPRSTRRRAAKPKKSEPEEEPSS
jgi:small subunit ribosomal protein S17